MELTDSSILQVFSALTRLMTFKLCSIFLHIFVLVVFESYFITIARLLLDLAFFDRGTNEIQKFPPNKMDPETVFYLVRATLFIRLEQFWQSKMVKEEPGKSVLAK